MYIIYINEAPLIICNEMQVEHYQNQFDNIVVHHYRRGRKGLFNYIDALEKSTYESGVILCVQDPQVLFQAFCSIYRVVEAAGGIVIKKGEGKLLAIFRRGNWDLPKGKIEVGESLEAAAVREVQEETGIQKIRLKRKIGVTYHTFRSKKNNRMLKVSHWYKMKTSDNDLIPQTEEDIEKVEWVDIQTFLSSYRPIYRNILAIVELYLASKKKKKVASLKV